MEAPRDVMGSDEAYRDFYESLGRVYPETERVHGGDPRRFRLVLGEIRPFAERGDRMLDIGCNDGVYTIPYCQAGGRAHGIDVSPSLIVRARSKSAGLPVTFEEADIEKYTSSEVFDLVLMSEVLEHLRDPGRGVRNAVALVRRGGSLLLTTPTPIGLVTTRQYLRQLRSGEKLVQRHTVHTNETIVGQEFGLSGYHYRHDGYYPGPLRRWLEGFGLECVRASTAVYRPSNVVLRALGLAEGKVDLRRIPGLNLLGETNVLLLKKP